MFDKEPKQEDFLATMGLEDKEEEVPSLINRDESPEEVERKTREARERREGTPSYEDMQRGRDTYRA